MLTSMEGGVRRKQTYEVELRRAIRKTGVGRGVGGKTVNSTYIDTPQI